VKRDLRILVATMLVATTVTLTAANASTQVGPPAGLTASGRVLWNFKALLHETFGPGYQGCLQYLSRYVLSFTRGSYCATHDDAETMYYSFAFAHASRSPYHLVDRTFPAGAFGNYPVPIRVDGDYVACDSAGRTFLISYGDVLGLSANLACITPSP